MRRLFLPLLALITLITLWPTHTLQDNCKGVCGRRPLATSHDDSKQTGGGVDVLPGAWPWMVSIRTAFNSGYQHTCGGSLIGAKWILTAAHCFNETRSPTNWELVFGASKLSQPGPDAQLRFPKRMVKHENYQPQQQINDIALIELDNPIQCSDYIQPACLPESSVNVFAMTHCYIAGWGYTQEKSQAPSDILKEAKVDLIPTEICNGSNWYYGSIRANNLCAGFEGGGIDTCQGDSGGPLMCRENQSEHFSVIGVTSWGSGCARAQKPGVYTSTQHFNAWIQGFTREQTSLLPDVKVTELPLTTELPSTTKLQTTTTELQTTTTELPTTTTELPATTTELLTTTTELPTTTTELSTTTTELPTTTTELPATTTELLTTTTIELPTTTSELPTTTSELSTTTSELSTTTTELSTTTQLPEESSQPPKLSTTPLQSSPPKLWLLRNPHVTTQSQPASHTTKSWSFTTYPYVPPPKRTRRKHKMIITGVSYTSRWDRSTTSELSTTTSELSTTTTELSTTTQLPEESSQPPKLSTTPLQSSPPKLWLLRNPHVTTQSQPASHTTKSWSFTTYPYVPPPKRTRRKHKMIITGVSYTSRWDRSTKPPTQPWSKPPKPALAK